MFFIEWKQINNNRCRLFYAGKTNQPGMYVADVWSDPGDETYWNWKIWIYPANRYLIIRESDFARSSLERTKEEVESILKEYGYHVLNHKQINLL